MAAFVRVLGPPNSNFLVGYPGISATLPRIEGKVEIRPKEGVSAPVAISLVSICLQRRETIHPAAELVVKRHLGTPRRETTDIVGKELLLWKCDIGRVSENVVLMDLPFVLFIPFGRGGQETNRRIPPASLQLPSRTAETCYELVVTVQQGSAEQRKFVTPVPILRYDTLSTFGMYNRPESADMVSDHLVTLGISLPRWSYGPLDPVSVYIKLSPNQDWLKKATKVMIQKITMAIEEEITYNHEGDEPTKKVNRIAKQTTPIGVRMSGTGYTTNLGLVFPSKENRDAEGIIRRGKSHFPMYGVNSFTTTGSLYKIEFFLIIKVYSCSMTRNKLHSKMLMTNRPHMTNTKDIVLRQPIIVCPFDQQACKEEMESIEQAAKDASHVDANNPMLPARTVIKATDRDALKALGFTSVGNQRKILIE